MNEERERERDGEREREIKKEEEKRKKAIIIKNTSITTDTYKYLPLSFLTHMP